MNDETQSRTFDRIPVTICGRLTNGRRLEVGVRLWSELRLTRAMAVGKSSLELVVTSILFAPDLAEVRTKQVPEDDASSGRLLSRAWLGEALRLGRMLSEAMLGEALVAPVGPRASRNTRGP